MQERLELERKKAVQKLKDEISAKTQVIKDMERQQQKDKALREKSESSIRMLEEMKDMQKNLQTDRDIIK